MHQFITRVELHNARSDDYVKLHAAMTAAKFQKFVKDSRGIQYELPTAEYYSFGPDINAEQVRDLALQAANSTGRASWVVVSEFLNAAWSLRPVTPPTNVLAELLNKYSVEDGPMTRALGLY